MPNGDIRRWGPRLLLVALVVLPVSAANVTGAHSSIWGSIFVITLAAMLVADAIDSLRTGQTGGKPFTADRIRHPTWFWADVLAHFAVAAMFLLALPAIWRE